MNLYTLEFTGTDRAGAVGFEIANIDRLAIVYFWASAIQYEDAAELIPVVCGVTAKLTNSAVTVNIADNVSFNAGQILAQNGVYLYANELLPWVGVWPIGGNYTFGIDYETKYDVSTTVDHWRFIFQIGYEAYQVPTGK